MSNAGGALILRAVVDELTPDYRLATEPWIGPYEARARLGLYQKLWLKRLGPAAGWPASALPRRLRSLLGVVVESEIVGILDASGFAYGDQVGPERTERAATAAEHWRRVGKKLILLPQAFGPFTTSRIRAAARRLFDASDLVFARDSESLAAVRELVADDQRIGLAPDLTVLVGPGDRDTPEPTRQPHAYIVPNVKVVRHGEVAEDAYLAFLLACVAAVRDRGVEPRILVHESREDGPLADRLNAEAGGLEIVRDDDPVRVKRLIRGSQLLVGSRFHALVSALSQAVPVVAVGWSHKYGGLLRDFDVPEALLAMPASKGDVEAAVARALDEPGRDAYLRRIELAAARQRDGANAMWRRVRSVLTDGGAAASP